MHKYLEIAKNLKQLILKGFYPLGSKLPSIRKISARQRCSPGTVQRGLQIIQQRGLIRPRNTRGYFVTCDENAISHYKQIVAMEITAKLIFDLDHLGFSEKAMVLRVKNEAILLSRVVKFNKTIPFSDDDFP